MLFNEDEKFANDKRSSLFKKSVVYGQKKFYNIGPVVFVKLGRKNLPVTNTLAYYENS